MQYLVAWVLCVVYLIGVSGMALSSLLCPCVDLHQHSEICCHDHGHTHVELHPLAAAHDADFSAPCCDDRHSNRMVLYTLGEDTERQLKVVVRDLPLMMLAEGPEPEHALPQIHFERWLDRVPLIRSCAVQLKALRAPPVLA